MRGIWLPIITPFNNGEVDYDSYISLIEHYIGKGITGIIPLGTTGECPTIEQDEFEKIIEITVDTVKQRIPVFVGAGGNYTKKVISQVKIAEKYNIDGILSVCPYYNKPNQIGIYEHFKAISESTQFKIFIYNIPYRTGINMTNDTLFKLAEFNNIVGVKDSCGNMVQSIDLINNKPDDFYALTGEDNFYYMNLANGGDGGVLASSHMNTEKFVSIFNLIKENNFDEALRIWKTTEELTSLLFKEPNPSPLKYCLKELGIIKSDEVRLPLCLVSDELKRKLDRHIKD